MKKDVELVIRARDEASRSGAAIADVLDRLAKVSRDAGAGAKDGAAGIDLLGSALSQVQREYRTIDKAADAASAAFERQKMTLSETRQQQQALSVQVAAAKAALERLRAEEVSGVEAKKAQVAQIKQVETAYNALIRQQAAVTKSADSQEASLNEAGLALQRLGSQATAAEIAVVETALRRSAQAAKDYTQAAREAAVASSSLSGGNLQQDIDRRLGIGRMPVRSATESGEVFVREQNRMSAAAAKMRSELYPLQQVQAEYNRKVAEANALHAAGAIRADELADQLRRLKVEAQQAGNALNGRGARGEKNINTLFGLKPYELQNLSYQINDVFTQLGSGTKPTQVLAQQGGQIAQIFAGRGGGGLFAKIATGAKSAVPWVALVAITLGTVAAAIKNIADVSKSAKIFDGQLSATADGGIYDPKMLAETAHELDVLAGSLKDARAQVSILSREGVAPAWIQDMAITSRNLSEVWGIDLVEATKEVSKGFTGQFKEIDELDKKYNFLTKAQRDHIKELFEQGKAEEGRIEAFKIFKGLMDKGAADMRGPWKEALQSLSQAWDNFLGWLGETGPIKAAIGWLKDLAKWAETATKALKTVKNRNEITRVEAKIEDLEEERSAAAGRTGQGGMPRGRALIRNAGNTRLDLGAIDKDLAAQRAKLAELQGQRDTDTRAPGSEADKKDEDRKAEAEAPKAAREADKAAREAEQRAREREAAAETLSRSLSALEARVGKLSTAPLEDRLAAVDKEYARIKRELEEAREKGVTEVDGLSLKDYEARVDANKVLLKQQAEMTYYSEAIKDLEDQRSARLKTIQDQLAEGAITQEQAFKAFDQVEAELAPAMASIAADALKFARALQAAKPSPELAAFIAKMEGVGRRESSPGGIGSGGQEAKLAAIAVREAKINELLSQRADLIALATAQYERGELTVEEYEARVQNAYDKTSLALMEQINSIQTMLDQMKAFKEIGDTAYDAWIAKIKLLRYELDNTSSLILTVADANQMLADAGVNAWNQFFDAIEEGKNVLTAFLDSMRQMFSDIFRDIAQIIIRAMIMRQLMKTGLGKWLSGATQGLFDADGAKEAAGALTAAGVLWTKVVAGLQAAAAQLAGAGGGAGGADLLGSALGFAGSLFGGGSPNVAAVAAHIRHTGGMAGGTGVQRMVPVQAFANAVRYHGGGLPGLRANEVASILDKTEEVITADDSRHVLNGGKSGGGGGSTKVVNVLDGPDLLTHALADERGQRVFVNFVRQNPGAFKAALGMP